MTIENSWTEKLFKLVFWLLCGFYIVFYMPFGFEGTDTGYIFGTSWNIYNGQIPHRDFIYTRPAIPAYFHTIFLFISETYGYLLDRSFFYVQIFVYSLVGAKLLMQHFTIKNSASVYFIAAVGALISIHNYPPMSWNTVDGVFFCMLGMYFLLRQNTKVAYILLGTVLVVLGVFSKQSFYFMPIFIFVYLLIKKDFFIVKYYTLFGIIAVAGYVSFKYFSNSLEPFWEQTFVRTSSSALKDAGIKTYYLALKFNWLYILALLVLIGLCLKYTSRAISFLVLNVVIASCILLFFIKSVDGWETIPFIFQIWWIASAGFCLVMLRKDKRYLLVLLLLALGWSASISNGYRTPIHFSLPLVFATFIFFFTAENFKGSKWVYEGVLLAYLATFFIGYSTIYRDSPRKELTYEMDTIFPQLAFIKSDKETFYKYEELKTLALKYPNFTVIPADTHAHYLTGTVNPIGTDWAHDAEINENYKSLIKKLEEKNTVVFIEATGYSSEQLSHYEIYRSIESNWKLIDSNEYFKVYTATSKSD